MNAKLTVYTIEMCGYYAHGGNSPDFGDADQCLTAIHEWVHQKKPKVKATRTFNKHENGEYLPTYCFDIAGTSGSDWLLTSWNETPSDDGVVGAVGAAVQAGTGTITTRSFAQGDIIGYGTHFWFLPNESRLVTVQFDSQPLNGHQGLNRYMNGYLERFSPHVRFDPNKMHDDVLVREIVGYAPDATTDEANDKLHPRYRSKLLRRDAELDYIRNNHQKIKKVIRKGRPSGGGQATKSLLDRALTFVGAPTNQRTLPDTSFIFEIPYRPSRSDVDAIINQWQQEADGDGHETWDDVGFDFRGETKRRWLSSSTLKLDADLPKNLRDGPGSVASADALLKELARFRSQVIA
jgi:hypothetical protein